MQETLNAEMFTYVAMWMSIHICASTRYCSISKCICYISRIMAFTGRTLDWNSLEKSYT